MIFPLLLFCPIHVQYYCVCRTILNGSWHPSHTPWLQLGASASIRWGVNLPLPDSAHPFPCDNWNPPIYRCYRNCEFPWMLSMKELPTAALVVDAHAPDFDRYIRSD